MSGYRIVIDNSEGGGAEISYALQKAGIGGDILVSAFKIVHDIKGSIARDSTRIMRACKDHDISRGDDLVEITPIKNAVSPA